MCASVPDDMVMSVLGGWLSQEDCVSRGWVLHGFPLNRDQAELLASAGHTPNRWALICTHSQTASKHPTALCTCSLA